MPKNQTKKITTHQTEKNSKIHRVFSFCANIGTEESPEIKNILEKIRPDIYKIYKEKLKLILSDHTYLSYNYKNLNQEV